MDFYILLLFVVQLDPDHMTPALALMKKRNNAVKSSLSRPLQNFTHLERTHSTSYITDIIQWKSRYNKDEELESKWRERKKIVMQEELLGTSAVFTGIMRKNTFIYWLNAYRCFISFNAIVHKINHLLLTNRTAFWFIYWTYFVSSD